MKKGASKAVSAKSNDMRAEYDFRGGVRGKHYKAMQTGYTITIHNPDGSSVIREVKPPKGAVVLEPDVQPYFPDSESVNTALRTLISVIPTKRKRVGRRARSLGAKRRIAVATRSKSAGKTAQGR